MAVSALEAISPIDGRYAHLVVEMRAFFSEQALMRYRLMVEIEYLIALVRVLSAKSPSRFQADELDAMALRSHYDPSSFGTPQAEQIKDLEMRCNHDVKAIEIYLQGVLPSVLRADVPEDRRKGYLALIHFGLTSQDVNNVAIPLALKEAFGVYSEALRALVAQLRSMARRWMEVPMMCRTHGQPATPSTLGKEIYVWVYRIERQVAILNQVPWSGKFGGATGQFNAHHVAFGDVDWVGFADAFVGSFGLSREQWTTQISNYDNLAAVLDGMKRINVVIIDACRDFWHYISLGYFAQIPQSAEEVGSSTMPHKINPIDFENAEGNLGISNALLGYMAAKLPISRMQRDLTDSTTLRSLAMPFAYAFLSLKVLMRGLKKIVADAPTIARDLASHPAVITEAIQTILRREGYPDAYDSMKKIARNNALSLGDIHAWIDGNLGFPKSVIRELKAITPNNYVGQYPSVGDGEGEAPRGMHGPCT